MIGFVAGIIVGIIVGMLAGGVAYRRQFLTVIRAQLAVLITRNNRLVNVMRRIENKGYHQRLLDELYEANVGLGESITEFCGIFQREVRNE